MALSKQQKAKLRRDWLKVHGKSERKMARVLSQYFKSQRKRLRDALADLTTITTADVPTLLDVDDEHAKLMAAVEPLIAEFLATGAARVLAQRPAKTEKAKTANTKAFDADMLDDFDLPPSMIAAIEVQFGELTEAEYWAAIQDGSLLSVTDTVQDGLEQGLSYPNLKKLVLASHKTFSEVRSELIARTETTGAMAAGHQASYESLKADGDDIRKEWLSIIDSDTRPAHAAADGQIVDVDAKFVVGGEECMYPGSPYLSAANRCRCRCSSAAVFGA